MVKYKHLDTQMYPNSYLTKFFTSLILNKILLVLFILLAHNNDNEA